ncbi:hypothetical protein SBRY_80233 [Actinacidiphila bryophytorum]|uniref:Uncharacterized protein n=1 Tax=Actinacidiphila bryophytorum TaxID=1436133 RepID=A0A9W4MK91_9ACTN|nr:hypothetical protein SBRY_80233 [Actinacidiphila bryophytorum]
MAPPSQIGGPPGRKGRVAGSTSSKCSTWPWKEKGPSAVHSRRHSATVSSSRVKRFSQGVPAIAYTGRPKRPGKPAPTPSTSRPPDSRSTEAMVCAACTGVRSAGSSAPVPSVTRSVTAASAASTVSASRRGVSSESVAHRESKPVRSARTPKATASLGSVRALHWTLVLGTKTPSCTVSAAVPPEPESEPESVPGPQPGPEPGPVPAPGPEPAAGPVPECVPEVLVMVPIVGSRRRRLNSRQGMAAARAPG